MKYSDVFRPGSPEAKKAAKDMGVLLSDDALRQVSAGAGNNNGDSDPGDGSGAGQIPQCPRCGITSDQIRLGNGEYKCNKCRFQYPA